MYLKTFIQILQDTIVGETERMTETVNSLKLQ